MTLRTREFKEQEDQNQYSYGFRHECQWYQDNDFVTLSAKRGTQNISGPRDMSMFVKKQMLVDAVSWALFWGEETRVRSIHFGGKLILSDMFLDG